MKTYSSIPGKSTCNHNFEGHRCTFPIVDNCCYISGSLQDASSALGLEKIKPKYTSYPTSLQLSVVTQRSFPRSFAWRHKKRAAQVTKGTLYHSRGKTGNSGWKLKSSFRNKSCDLRRCSFTTYFGLFQLIWIYPVASRSPFRVKLNSFMYMHKISTQMDCVNGTMVIILFMVNNVGTSPDS